MEGNLRELRNRSNLTLKQVANSIGVSVSTLSNYEQGTRTVNIHLVLKLSKVYDCTAEEIIQAQIKSLEACAS